MKVTLESTDAIVELATSTGHVPARIWEGFTESGIRVHAFVTRIAVHKESDNTQFERELLEQRPLSKELQGVYDLRMVL